MVNKLKEYIKTEYNAKEERPWKSYPEYTTFKDPLSGKWFALLMNVKRSVIGLFGDEEIWVLNVKADSDFIMFISGTKGFMPGYHMNKEHWLTVLLDGTVSFEEVLNCVDRSYLLITDTPTKRIYEAVKKIPKGKVATYGRVAEMAGDRKMARAVGNALHKNPDPDSIPCYRVVNSEGRVSEAFVFGGENRQIALLEADGIEVIDGKVDLKKYGI